MAEQTEQTEIERGIGDNSGETPDAVFADLVRRAEEQQKAHQAWAKAEITSAETAEKLNAFVEQTRLLWRDFDALRVERKRPHDEAAKKVQNTFLAYMEPLDAIHKAGKTIRAKWLAAEEARRKEEARKRQEEELARARAAAEEARLARERNEEIARAQAEKIAQEAEKAAQKSDPEKVTARVESVTGGSSTGLRTVREARIDNITMAVAYYRNHPKMAELVLSLANADIRSAKGAEISIPGISIVTRRV